MNPPRFDWSAERIQQLRDLAERGYTATQIANQIGASSRNAVIGKANRLGIRIGIPRIKGRTRPGIPARPPGPRKKVVRKAPDTGTLGPLPAPVEPEKVEALFEQKVAEINAEPKLLTLLELPASGACRWPVGDPKTEEFRFCGADCGGSIYCQAHRRLAYDPRVVAIVTGPRRAA